MNIITPHTISAQLRAIADCVRQNILALEVPLGSALSCADILTTLYFGGVLAYCTRTNRCEGRDRFLLSKGHGAAALYVILCALGYFDTLGGEKVLSNLAKNGAPLVKHPEYLNIPGIDFPSGALGLILGAAAGIGLALKQDRKDAAVFALLGDGECDRGTVWEAADFIASKQLNNVITIVDANRLSYSDYVDTKRLAPRWAALGYHVTIANGHNVNELRSSLYHARCRANTKDAPSVIIAQTTKGYGLPALAGKIEAHEANYGSQRPKLDISKLRELIRTSPFRAHRCQSLNPHTLRSPSLPPIESKTAATRDLGRDLAYWTKVNPSLVVLCPDVQRSTRLDDLMSSRQFVHMGLREQCTIGVASGLAISGKTVVVSGFDGFFLNAILEIKCMMAIPVLPVILLASHSGIAVGVDGPTHHSCETPVAMTAISGLTCFEPSDLCSARMILEHRLTATNGPCYIRLSRHAVPVLPSDNVNASISTGFRLVAGNLDVGVKVVLLAAGTVVAQATTALEILRAQHILGGVIDVFSQTSFRHSSGISSLRSRVGDASIVAFLDANISMGWAGLDFDEIVSVDEYYPGWNADYLYRLAGLSAHSIALRVRNLLRKKEGAPQISVLEYTVERINELSKLGQTVKVFISGQGVHDFVEKLTLNNEIKVVQNWATSDDVYFIYGQSAYDAPQDSISIKIYVVGENDQFCGRVPIGVEPAQADIVVRTSANGYDFVAV